MPDSDGSRLAVLEQRVSDVCASVDTIAQDMKNTATKDDIHELSVKLDAYAAAKADTTYVAAVDGRVTELRGWLWGLVIAVGLSLLGTIGALFVAVIKAGM